MLFSRPDKDDSSIKLLRFQPEHPSHGAVSQWNSYGSGGPEKSGGMAHEDRVDGLGYLRDFYRAGSRRFLPRPMEADPGRCRRARPAGSSCSPGNSKLVAPLTVARFW